MSKRTVVLPEWSVSALAGLSLIVCAAIMIRGHRLEWRRFRTARERVEHRFDDPDADFDNEAADQLYEHHQRRYRRRMQTSSLLIVIGLLIPIGDAVIPWAGIKARHPDKVIWIFTFYWGSVLLLAFWVMLMAIGDLFSTSTHAKSELARIRTRQRLLEREVLRLRSETDTDPHA